MNTLMRSLSAELLKAKHTMAAWLIVVAALFLPLMQLLSYLHTDGKVRLTPNENPWDSFAQNSVAISSIFITPMFVVLLVCLLVDVEHKSMSWKHLLVLPMPKENLFLSKLLLLLGMVLNFYGLFLLFILLDGWFLTSFLPGANPDHRSPNWPILIRLMVQSICSVLPILAIQYWLCFRIKNLISTIGIGLIGLITGLVLASPGTWGGVYYYPYAYPALLTYRLNPNYHYPDYPMSIYGLLVFGFVTGVSYWDFKQHFRG